MLNLALIAIPSTVFLILLEYYLSGSKRKELFNFKHSIANMSHGIFERFSSILLSLLYFFPYKYISENFGLFDIKANVFSWIGIILFMDFCWYWYHRFGHTVNIMWAGHVVHHQSETYNFTTGTRITMIQSLYRFIFYAAVPLMGFPIEMIMASLIFHGMFSFFAHTQLIGKLGFLEYIIITPSHHRVHHANNDEYLDKNYGNVFIFWDYLFGTFKKEETQPVYGLTKQIENYSFLYNNFHYYVELYYAVKAKKNFKDKLKVLFGPPTMLTGEERAKAEKHFAIKKGDLKISDKTYRRNVLLRVVIMLYMASIAVGYHQNFSTAVLIFSSLIIFLGLYQLGRVIEHKRPLFSAEIISLTSCVVILFQGFEPYLFIPVLASTINHVICCLDFGIQFSSNKIANRTLRRLDSNTSSYVQ